MRNAIGLLQIDQSIDVFFYRNRQLYETTVQVRESDSESVEGIVLGQHLQGATFENAQTRTGRGYVVVSQVEPGTGMGNGGQAAGCVACR